MQLRPGSGVSSPASIVRASFLLLCLLPIGLKGVNNPPCLPPGWPRLRAGPGEVGVPTIWLVVSTQHRHTSNDARERPVYASRKTCRFKKHRITTGLPRVLVGFSQVPLCDFRKERDQVAANLARRADGTDGHDRDVLRVSTARRRLLLRLDTATRRRRSASRRAAPGAELGGASGAASEISGGVGAVASDVRRL
jgi:hypothetical protein